MADTQPLVEHRYLSLATFRKSGKKVATPVWFAPDDGALWVFSAPDSGKVKRLRNSSRAEVAPCDVRGNLRGDWAPATATLVDDPARRKRAISAIRRRYGWQMWIADVGAWLARRIDQRQVIRIDVA